MRRLTELAFDNSYARLPPAYYEVVDPTALGDPYLVAFNPDAAALIDLDPAEAAEPEAPAYLSGSRRLPGAEPIAMLYAGHQFGVWVPQLGDGRAILLGEVIGARGDRWDLHLKGGGQTRFSRMGDGRAVLRSTIREYLASEAMHALGIPTTRALAITGSDDLVYREAPETAATLIRMAPSHVRFGTFQVFAARGQPERVAELADYLIRLHDADLAGEPDRHRRWLERIVDRTADLMARWMAVGFAHGVMNTDNMSVLGLTLDYGPYGFLDEYDPGFICNHSDHEGRYAFDRQPAIGLWNLARFAEALLELVPFDAANTALNRYPSRFEATYGSLIRAKLGLDTERADDTDLVAEMLGLMAANRVDYTRWFRTLAVVPSGAAAAPESLRGMVSDLARLDGWIVRYGARLAAEGRDDGARRGAMNRVNPKFVLRNYLAQQAIDRARLKDYGEIERLRSLLATPFDEHPGLEHYADPPPPWGRELVVSCSS
ncbi:MAG: YdiU family protein [Gemmatimonadales bacterium]|nr:YdiU family protein [Gemmatimonadales bacterium]